LASVDGDDDGRGIDAVEVAESRPHGRIEPREYAYGLPWKVVRQLRLPNYRIRGIFLVTRLTKAAIPKVPPQAPHQMQLMEPQWLSMYSVSEATQNRKRIVTHEGRWWLLDFRQKTAVHLDPLFVATGWNVSELCMALNIENRTFMRIVDKSLGINAKIWLRQQRLITACHMIRAEGQVKKVSNQLGFRNESDFAREFRKLMNLSPSGFLKSERSRMITLAQLGSE
jgi:AraC-like DNA-binding protein